MLIQPLLDKLTQLRLPGIRAGLEEQLQNPQYAELSFEDRLGLLVDLECTRRADNSLRRRIKTARFTLPATIEDLEAAMEALRAARAEVEAQLDAAQEALRNELTVRQQGQFMLQGLLD